MTEVAAQRSRDECLERAMHTAEGRRDPYPYLAELVVRDEAIVLDDGSAFVFSHDQATETLRSPSFLKHGEHASSAQPEFTPEQLETLRRERPAAPGMLSSIDDPDHVRLRRLVSLAFAPKSIDHYVPLIHESLDRLLNDMDRREPVDLVSTLNAQIPSQVVGELIGLPLSDRGRFAELAGLQSLGRDPNATFDEQLTAARARREMYEFVEGLIGEARDRLRDDTPVGRLVKLEQEGEKITHEELVSLVATVYSAGFGTTVRMLGNGLVALLRHPAQARFLRENPDRARQVTDEVLRYDTPVMTVAYYAAEGAEVAGQPLEEGKLCTVVLGAANHDPRAFHAPEEFDVTRERDRAPMSFGSGIHYCLGAPLARLEGDIVYAEMVRRFPHMQLVEDPPRQDTVRARAFTRILVVLEPR